MSSSNNSVPPRRLRADEDLAAVIPRGALTWVPGCSAQSEVLASMVRASGERLGPVTFSGIFVAGLNRQIWAEDRASRLQTYFLTPEIKALGDRRRFLPLNYSQISARLAAAPPQCALMMVSPPDEHGRCSFGACVDFIADIWPHVPVRVAHVNPAMPRTSGDAGIPFEALTSWIEVDQALASTTDRGSNEAAGQIAAAVAAHVPDGATLQTGLGNIPGAVLRALAGHRDLAIYSGLIGDPVLDLLEAGALRTNRPIVAGVAIGSQRLYESISNPAFAFHPPSITHDRGRLAAIDRFITINSATEVDLFGQAYAEMGPHGFMSGPGGASDFANGAGLSKGGLRIVVLPSTAGGRSRIVMPPGRGPVSLGRFETDLVITEHGVADLRGQDHDQRAFSLIMIAAAPHREALSGAWSEFSKEYL